MVYVYEHPETGERREVSQGMNDVHEYYEDSVKWNRVWLSPQLSIDTQLDPYSSKDFVQKTSKGGSLGDIFDRSLEMSEKRKAKDGVDHIQKAEVERYRKETGLMHPSELKKI